MRFILNLSKIITAAAARKTTPVNILYVKNGCELTAPSIPLAMLGPNTAMQLNSSTRDRPVGNLSMPRIAAVIGDTIQQQCRRQVQLVSSVQSIVPSMRLTLSKVRSTKKTENDRVGHESSIVECKRPDQKRAQRAHKNKNDICIQRSNTISNKAMYIRFVSITLTHGYLVTSTYPHKIRPRKFMADATATKEEP